VISQTPPESELDQERFLFLICVEEEKRET